MDECFGVCKKIHNSGSASCWAWLGDLRFDELTIDTSHNRFVRKAFEPTPGWCNGETLCALSER